jgi:predicted protein tyrosine phosphatase
LWAFNVQASSESMERDAMASYYEMLKWVVSSDETYVDAAERIIDAWSGYVRMVIHCWHSLGVVPRFLVGWMPNRLGP